MLLNYFKLALRLMARNPFSTCINVTGLAVGFATFLLLWPYAANELKSDQYHPDANRIVRLGVDLKWTDDNQNWNGFLGAFNFWGVAHAAGSTFPKVESITRLVPQLNFKSNLHTIDRDFFVSIRSASGNNVIHRETQAIFADTNFFQFFKIPLVEGDAQSVIDAPNTVALSKTCSKRYFGEVSALGKTIYLNDTIPVKVTGVFMDLPQNTHLRFDLVLSVGGKKGFDISEWNGWTGYCYVKLQEGYNPESFRKDLEKEKAGLYGFVKAGCPHCEMNSLVQPLSEVVFSDLRGNSFHSKSKFLLKGLYAVSFLVLFLGWVNYISLSIHSLNKRLTEFTTRKVVGAGMKEFLLQFVVESIVINLIAFSAALTLFQLSKGLAEQLLGIYIPAWSELSGNAILVIASVLVGGIVITAIYPMLLIQKHSKRELSGKMKYGLNHSIFNSVLTTGQYASAIVLLIWIVTSNSQVSFILEKDIGMKRNGVVVVEGPTQVKHFDDSKISSFLKEVSRIKGVQQSTVSYSLVGEPDVKGLVIQRNRGSNFVGVDTNGGVDENFLATFQLTLIAGRNFLADNPADKNSILISRALVRRLGFASPEEAIGQHLMLPDFNVEHVEIIGVFPDYEFRPYFNDTREHNRGIALMYKDYLVSYFKPMKLSLSVDMNEFKTIISKVETLHRSLLPEETFSWYWLDKKIERQYNNEQKAKNQIAFFTLLAIGIACLGLLGLISNRAIEKTKEIGIRKVLGAELHQIAQLLLNTTAKQIVIATILGIPVAYYFTLQYLEKFSERISLQWWHFALPVVMLVLIMLCTVATVVWRAAKSNPVEALKYE